VIASLSHFAQIYLVNGETPPRRGTWGNGGMPAGVFRCRRWRVDAGGRQRRQLREPARCWAARGSRQSKFVRNNDRVVHGKEIMALLAGLSDERVPGRLIGCGSATADAVGGGWRLSWSPPFEHCAVADPHPARSLRTQRSKAREQRHDLLA